MAQRCPEQGVIAKTGKREDLRLINLAFESERAGIPKAKFIRFSGADLDAYRLPRKGQGAAQVPLVPEKASAGRDQADARERTQVRARRPGQKDFRYLTKTYLPRKLKEED